MDFYQVLLEIMDEKSFSIPDVARATGLSDSTIRSIISRKTKKASLDVAFKMYKGLGVSLERLNGEEINNSNPNNNLSKEETTLLENYNKLDSDDKTKVIDYTNLLSNQDKYKSANKSASEITATTDNVVELDIQSSNSKNECYTLAAHDDDLNEETKKRNLEKVKNIFKQMDEE